ncbi:hypothetical protein K4F52_008261 [Lecanicillium sp. MT-2017a]|nr:hypothetical protein K4F52_008261 [Lecanicillium sp. MT-2017a]
MAKASLFMTLLPLVLALGLFSVIGWVGYQIYLSINKMGETASERMGKKNVVFTKDGMRVGVKQVKNENYVDATQNYVVKAWNLGQAQDQSQDKKRK